MNWKSFFPIVLWSEINEANSWGSSVRKNYVLVLQFTAKVLLRFFHPAGVSGASLDSLRSSFRVHLTMKYRTSKFSVHNDLAWCLFGKRPGVTLTRLLSSFRCHLYIPLLTKVFEFFYRRTEVQNNLSLYLEHPLVIWALHCKFNQFGQLLH